MCVPNHQSHQWGFPNKRISKHCLAQGLNHPPDQGCDAAGSTDTGEHAQLPSYTDRSTGPLAFSGDSHGITSFLTYLCPEPLESAMSLYQNCVPGRQCEGFLASFHICPLDSGFPYLGKPELHIFFPVRPQRPSVSPSSSLYE